MIANGGGLEYGPGPRFHNLLARAWHVRRKQHPLYTAPNIIIHADGDDTYEPPGDEPRTEIMFHEIRRPLSWLVKSIIDHRVYE